MSKSRLSLIDKGLKGTIMWIWYANLIWWLHYFSSVNSPFKTYVYCKEDASINLWGKKDL